MSKKFDISRRRTAGFLLKTVALTSVASMIKIPVAFAGDLPHVTSSDPTAVALHYVDDAAKGERTAKSGVPAKDQECATCQFIQSTSGAWRPCALFPGKEVNAHGWCMNWSKKS